MKALLTGVFALCTAGAVNAEPVAQTVPAVLAAHHQAVGDAPAKGSAEFDYAYEGSGLTGTEEVRADLATGAFTDVLASGRIGQATGYDGKVPWQRDLSGANTPQEGGDRIPAAVNDAYRNANLWWRADHGGAQVAYVGRETVDGRAMDHLKVTPKGGKPFDAWFDADTHLLARIAEDRQFFHTKTFLSDYRREGGLTLAHAITRDPGAGEGAFEKLKLTRFAIVPAKPVSAYARPTAPPTGVTIDGGATTATVPFRLLNNHIYVEAMVNGKGPYTFIVDTGGHNLLSPRVVREVGLKPVGAATTSGAGEGTETSGFAQVDEIAIGPVKMRDQMGFTTEIYKPAIEGIPVDGMVGFELFARLAVVIDYGKQTMTMTEFAHFDPKGLGTPVPFVFYDHLPSVKGKIDDLPARFDIDTGSRVEVDVTSPFVAQKNLRARFAKGVSAVTGWGVGGPSRSYVVRMPSLTLGAVRVDGPTAGLSEAKGGSISDPNYEGNIGSGFLKRFVTSFDYSKQIMYLKPIVPPPVDAGRFDRSGMWINAGPDGYVVTDVSTGGPASEAGVQVGDVITELDGKPVTSEGLSDARILLRSRAAGEKIPLAIKRKDGAAITATLTLRDQI
jgi:hypothetical protein